MVRTVIAQVVGYYMGNKNHLKKGGQSHLQFEILGLLYPEVGLKMEPKNRFGKLVFRQFLRWGDVGVPSRVGFWFIRRFDPITICIEMAHYHLTPPHGVPEIWEPEIWSLWPKWAVLPTICPISRTGGEIDPPSFGDFCSPYNTPQLGKLLF